MSATFPSQMVRRAVACALGRCASESEITLRPTAPHQSNRLYDVYVDGEHLIAKEYLRADIPDAAQHEYEAFRYLAAYAQSAQHLALRNEVFYVANDAAYAGDVGYRFGLHYGLDDGDGSGVWSGT